MIHRLAPLLLKVMMALVPLNTHSYIENEATTRHRYEAIAEDIAEVAENNSVFDNDDKGIKIGLLLVIIASTESRYEAAVDNCTRAGDNGTSFSIFQLSNAFAPRYAVCHDRKVAVQWAIKAIKQSFYVCRNLPLQSRLSAYDTGRCLLNEHFSLQRMRLLDKLLRDYATDIANL